MSNYDKFTQALIEMSMVSGQDDQVGCTGEAPFDWAALFTFTDDERTNGIDMDDQDGYVYKFMPGNYAGAILFCNNDGIYSCERYSSSDILHKRWAEEVKDLTVESED